MPHEYKRFKGTGITIPHPLPLTLIMRLLDWCIESHEGHEIDGKASPCWNWQGHCDTDGYAQIKWREKKFQASRIAFTAFCGPLANGNDVDHLCLNRACVNPAHLESVDPWTNRVHRKNARKGEAIPI